MLKVIIFVDTTTPGLETLTIAYKFVLFIHCMLRVVEGQIMG